MFLKIAGIVSEHCRRICLEKFSFIPDPWLPDFPKFCQKKLAFYLYIYIYQFRRSMSLDSHSEQPAVAPLFHATATWESATDLNKISLDLHKSDRKPRSPGGRISTCQRSHLQSDRTHQMRKTSRAKTLKVLDRIFERSSTEKPD